MLNCFPVNTQLCEKAVPPIKEYCLTDQLISSYPCDQATKAALNQLKQSNTGPAVFQVSSVTFCVNGVATASNSVGFCHIRNTDSKFICASSDCARFASNTKAAKHKRICMHQHVLLCILQSSGEPATAHTSEAATYFSPSTAASHSSDKTATLSSPSASSGSCNETVTISSLSASSSSSPNETVAFSSLSAPSSGSSNETVTLSGPSVTSALSDEIAVNATSQESEVLVAGRQATLQLKMQLSFPYDIPRQILQNILHLDSETVLGEGGWPSIYEPKEETCVLCGASLSSAHPHPGQKTGDGGFLITNAVVFKKITILVKHCRKCKVLIQVFPYMYDLGLFNISDKLLVSLDILLEWREEFKRGVPPTLAVESKLATLIKKTTKEIPSTATLEYVTDLLYNGFYCFEAITERDLDETICGICGVADGNEKNCCSRKEISYNKNDSADYSHPILLEDLLERIKQHWVERTTYTRSSEPFSVDAFTLPPIIPRKMRGKAVFNTEGEKKTYTVSKGKTVEGDPAKLHIQIRDFDVDMQSLEKLSLPELRALCEECDIPVTSNKSQQCLRGDLHQLYATLLLGNYPCHGFTQVPGKTGEFYHLVCRHGVTVASKFLTLQESVRNAADLYLSLKYPPPVFVCDTPCGFVRHMDCRNKTTASKLWGSNSGCFEVPSVEKMPKEGANVPEIVPAEFRPVSVDVGVEESADKWVHPITGSLQRYILGDRFHSTTNPHKSPLCNFHDINLCLQANALKTSYQEAENNRKNKKRLQSACVQGFGTHFLFNYLMDFYQNEMIIDKQLLNLKKRLPEGFQVKRDKYMRFIYEPVEQ